MRCPKPDCKYSTGEQTESVAIAYLEAYMYVHIHPTPAPHLASAGTIHRSGLKLDRPTIETGVSMEKWNTFERRWAIFKEGSHVADENASHYLFQCADEPLSDSLSKQIQT